jgi:UDP-glucuronate 4-epimerase
MYNMKRVFVTGAAGFIGSFLMHKLQERGDFCLGLDSFNDYYDPQLKRARAQNLPILEGNILEEARVRKLLEEHKITHVVHLAAQAGVRHSLKHPYAYTDANINGFVSMLEACKNLPVHFTYASSSSVYGLNKKIPFAENDVTDSPANLYGATKKSNELIASAYHNLYQIPVTGLRFFTVYGPWGRPDMAYYQFAERIMNDQPIQIFNHGKMERDFTYITDIVDGIVAAIDMEAKQEVFNLGNNRPVPLLYFVTLLERALGKEAIKEFLPMQPGEVLTTYADIDKAQRMLGYSPKMSIEEGIQRFVNWFLKAKGNASMMSLAVMQ